MRKMLNTLYVMTPESYLTKDGEDIVISVKQQETFRLPIINIEQIVMFSYMGASPGAMKLCADHGVSLTFLSPNGRFISRCEGPVHGNVLLRIAQYKASENENTSHDLNKLFISGKIRNYLSIVSRFTRDYGMTAELQETIRKLSEYKRLVLQSDNDASLRGIEGEAASTYFGIFPSLIVQQRSDFPFHGRNRRPPKDAVNAMLSFAYTLICNDVVAALDTVGLDPYVGFFHTLRPGRPSLALDMMEELRAYLGDRFVLSLINRRQVSKSDFKAQGEEGIIMTDACRRNFIKAWQSRKRDTITHPFLGDKIELGLLPYAQAMLLVRYLRKDINDYPVFLIK